MRKHWNEGRRSLGIPRQLHNIDSGQRPSSLCYLFTLSNNGLLLRSCRLQQRLLNETTSASNVSLYRPQNAGYATRCRSNLSPGWLAKLPPATNGNQYLHRSLCLYDLDSQSVLHCFAQFEGYAVPRQWKQNKDFGFTMIQRLFLGLGSILP